MSSKLSTSFDVIKNYRQYRSFDNLYLFKVKGDDIKLKIFNVSQKYIFKKAFLISDLKKINVYKFFAEQSYFKFLKALVKKHLLDSQLFSITEITLKKCQQMSRKAIQDFKIKVSVESKELEDFCCPITFEVFRNPVIDEHGHTFEKEAIENHFNTIGKNECPINRQSINSLTPNRILRQTIEERQKKDPIPNFSLFKKENAELAKSSLQMAKNFIKAKEYNCALESFAKAFKFTKNWKDYETLPTLFANMGEIEKTTLAYLYLAYYQLKDNQVIKAIKTLENCQSSVEINSPLNLLLLSLYQLNNQSQKSSELIVKITKSLLGKKLQKAIILYKKILRIQPNQFDAYLLLSKLLMNPNARAHILLKGACHALHIENYKFVESFCQKAYKCSKFSFIDQMVFLQFLYKQQKFSDIKSRLSALAIDYEKENLFTHMLKAYKMLFQIEKRPKYYQKIVLAYKKLEKVWRKLEQSYSPENNLVELKNLWKKMGKYYIKNNQLIEAERVYRKTFNHFKTLDHAMQLASILVKLNKESEGVQIYYKASLLAMLNNNLEKLAICTSSIRKVDPKMQFLKADQRINILTQTTILTFSDKLQQGVTKNILLEKKISLMKKEFGETKQKLKEAEDTIEKLVKAKNIKEKRIEELLKIPFGKTEWEKYFGDVGVVPSLPPNIIQILESPCPIWADKKIADSFLLVLMPSKINHFNFSLTIFEDLIKNPKAGFSTKCITPPTFSNYPFNKFFKERILNPTVSNPYWFLLSKKVIPSSFKKINFVREIEIKTRNTCLKVSSQLPSVLEVAVSISTHYVRSKKCLYSNTYAICDDPRQIGRKMLVGYVSSNGFKISNSYFENPSSDNVVIMKFRRVGK
jgi:tetratricopeptide (TPR) repeat protein